MDSIPDYYISILSFGRTDVLQPER